MKICTRCGLNKDDSEYHQHSQARDGLYSSCKMCRHDLAVVVYQNNKEQLNAASSAWQKANPEKVSIRNKKYRSDPEKLEKCSNAVAAWQKNNLAAVAASSAQRRAMKKQATPVWADKEMIDAIYHAAQLESKRQGQLVCVDHIYPLCSDWVCGLHVEENLGLLFSPDNIAKRNRQIPLVDNGLGRMTSPNDLLNKTVSVVKTDELILILQY